LIDRAEKRADGVATAVGRWDRNGGGRQKFRQARARANASSFGHKKGGP
jgi:hypothetical protein